MSPKLALLALAGALSLSGCYYVPYGYYPSYPPPLSGTYQTQPGVAGAQANGPGEPGTAAGQQATQQYDPNSAPAQQPQYASAQPPVVGYAPYPAYYPAYPAYGYAPYPAYYGGYPAYGYAPNVSIGLGFGWGGGWGGGYHGGGHGWHGH